MEIYHSVDIPDAAVPMLFVVRPQWFLRLREVVHFSKWFIVI